MRGVLINLKLIFQCKNIHSMKKSLQHLTFFLAFQFIVLFPLTSQDCTGTLTCEGFLNVSLDIFCEGLISVDDILLYPCPTESYSVHIEDFDGNPVPNPVTGDYIGQAVRAYITAASTGNSCYSDLIIEDKFQPAIDFIGAPINLSCQDDFNEVIGVGAIDNCSLATTELTDIEYICGGCGTDSAILTWTATDESGNTSTASRLFNFIDFCSFVVWPEDISVACISPYPGPDVTGSPVFTDPDFVCTRDIVLAWDDIRLGCNITRLWSITDVCSGISIIHDQLINVVDDTPPTISAPAEENISLNRYNGGWSPEFTITDDCPTVEMDTSISFVANSISCDPVSFEVVYTIEAMDACGNSSSASTVVNVSSGNGPSVRLKGTKSCDGPFEVETVVLRMVEPYSYSFTSSNPAWSVASIGGGKAMVTPGIGTTFIEVVVTDAFGCMASDDKRYRCMSLGASFGRSTELPFPEDVRVYPNPVKDILTIEAEQIMSYSIMNTEGKQLLMNANIKNQGLERIDVHSLIPGIYVMKIKTEEGVFYRKVLKQ
jgi:hypothetical protein